MPQEAAPVLRGVRVTLAGATQRTGDRRTLDDRLFVRFPSLFRVIARLSMLLPPRSRLRRLALRRALLRGYAAANRRDFECVHVTQDPGIEMRFRGGFFPPDMDRVFRGHHGYRELWERALGAFEDLRLEPEELLDLGDRLLVTIRHRGQGLGSGVPIDQQAFQLFTLRRGLVIRQDDFADRSEALKAAGLST